MRLNQQELDAIKDVIGHHLGEAHAELFLHGSRVDHKLKGGDIDLLLVVDDAQKKFLSIKKYKILSEIKNLICDQKIDLLVANTEQLKSDPFLKLVFPNAVLIKKW